MHTLFILLQYLLPHHCLSRLAGYITQCQWRWFKNTLIRWFIKRYDVDMSEAAESDLQYYTHFNAFFTRALKEGARPIATTKKATENPVIVSPADGCISQLGTIDKQCLFQAKNHHYSLLTLLGDNQVAADSFQNGSFATVYLAPNNYHRVHMPISGTLQSMTYVPGTLFSVNSTTVDHIPNLFARNERVICLFDTAAGSMGLILIGAMLVASIETVWAGEVAPSRRRIHTYHYREHSPIHLQQGEEMGRFKLGSTVIVLFGPKIVSWQEHFQAGSKVCMGEAIGRL